MNIQTVNLSEKFSTFDDYWNPRIIGKLNGQLVKIAKCKGDFIMHKHIHEDELFYVHKGTLFIEMANKTLEINAGEFAVMPKGVDHRPYAPEEVHLLLFEPENTLNTGDKESDLTRTELTEI